MKLTKITTDVKTPYEPQIFQKHLGKQATMQLNN